MGFLAPMWLWGLVAWAGVTAYLLAGQRHRVGVPFLDLWQGPEGAPKVRRRVTPPPISLVMLIGAMLLMILSAARPVLRTGKGVNITIVLDRGITMMPAGRMQESADRVDQLLRDSGPVDRLTVIPVPGKGSVEFFGEVDWTRFPPVPMDVPSELAATVRRTLSQTTEPIVVVTDRPVEQSDRVVQIAPSRIPENVGIVSIAARGREAMVRVRNDSDLSEAKLLVDGVERTINLPARGSEADFFVETAATQQLQVRLEIEDDLPVDNAAWLVKVRSWPTIELRTHATPELQRMVETYRQHRPASQASRTVVIGQNEQADVWIEEDAAQRVEEEPTAAAHPVVQGVDWAQLKDLRKTSREMPAGYSPVLSAGDNAIIGVKHEPRRGVWIGFSSQSLQRTPAYVIFWTNVLDWVGQGGDEWQAHPPRPLASGWRRIEPAASEPMLEAGLWPGVYARGDERVAVHAPAPKFAVRKSPSSAPNPSANWNAASTGQSAGGLLAVLGVLLACVGLLLWPVRRLTGFAGVRSV
jgi:hypothetical protein